MAEKVRPGALTGANGGRECLARADKPEHSPGRCGVTILSRIESAESISIPAAQPLRVQLYGAYCASAARITVDYRTRRRGSPICALARKLIEAGHDPATIVHVYRGDTLCFRPAPLSRWAAIRVKEGDRECVRFVPHRAHPGQKGDPCGRVWPFIRHPDLPSGWVPEAAGGASSGEHVRRKGAAR